MWSSYRLQEDRYLVVGNTAQGRKLFIVFTQRKQKIRVISARDLNKKNISYWRGKRRIMKKLLKLPKFKNEDEEQDF